MAGTEHDEVHEVRPRLSKDPVHVRRRRLAAAGLAGVLLLGGCAADALMSGEDKPATTTGTKGGPGAASAPAPGDAADSSGAADGEAAQDGTGEDDATTSGGGAIWQREPTPVAAPSDTTSMEQVDYLTGGLTPKSVMASGHGLAIANNMMYSHTSTVFDTQTREQVAVLEDGVDLADFGVKGHPGISQGAPVEAVWTDDGRYAYVSQYTMYGENFGVEGFDECSVDSGVGPSFVYRFDAEEMAWDQVIQVGAVPKYVALSPDQKTLLVSNWCDATLSVVDTGKAQEVGTVPMDAAPRGIVILPDNNTAYSVAMYGNELYKIDIGARTSKVVMDVESRPRHLNLTADGKTMYMAVSGANKIFKMDTATDTVVDEVTPGQEPRSVTMSPDETALYVVNYNEASVSKIRTSDMEVIDTVKVDANPIGIDYDPVTHTVWVACYGGSIYVFDDQGTPL